jgi:hypothetical protein
MNTRVGRLQVTFSIPSGETFIAFTVDDIIDLGHAKTIQRALLDGGCASVNISVRTESEVQPFVAVYQDELPKGSVIEKTREYIGRFSRTNG